MTDARRTDDTRSRGSATLPVARRGGGTRARAIVPPKRGKQPVHVRAQINDVYTGIGYKVGPSPRLRESRLLAPSGHGGGGEFTQPRAQLLADPCKRFNSVTNSNAECEFCSAISLPDSHRAPLSANAQRPSITSLGLKAISQ